MSYRIAISFAAVAIGMSFIATDALARGGGGGGGGKVGKGVTTGASPRYRGSRVSEIPLPLAAVQQRERDTMHPHFITAMLLRVDAIPIHPARKYSPGEDHRVGRTQPARGAAP